MPYHLLLDSAGEAKLGSLQIGTTRRGIGPCYADKAARLGIRVQDLLDEKILKKKIVAAMEPKRLSLRPFEKDPTLDLHTMTEEYLDLRPPPGAAHRRHRQADVGDARRRRDGDLRGRAGSDARHRPRHLSVRHLLQPARRAPPASAPASGRRTSTRCGGSPRRTPRASARGRSRASCTTRWASGSATRGGEFGTTTGRPRRTGWLDLVALRYAARLNTHDGARRSPSSTCSPASTASRCARATAARKAREFDDFPYHQTVLHHTAAELTELRGWKRGPRRVPHALRPARGGARVPAVHRRAHRRARRARRRRPGPRADDLDRGRRRRRCSAAARTARTRSAPDTAIGEEVPATAGL